MLIVTPQREIDAYYADEESVSQSNLKRLLKDIDDYNRQEDSSQEHFVIGGAVDCILTAEEGEFEKRYHISNSDKKPSEKIVKILWTVFERLSEDYAEYLQVVNTPVSSYEVVGETKIEGEMKITSFKDFVGDLTTWGTYILDACDLEEYQPNWGAAAKLKAI